jgi:hypothetical protein
MYVAKVWLACPFHRFMSLLQASGYTPLMTATEYNRTPIVELLLRHNAKVDAQNRVLAAVTLHGCHLCV